MWTDLSQYVPSEKIFVSHVNTRQRATCVEKDAHNQVAKMTHPVDSHLSPGAPVFAQWAHKVAMTAGWKLFMDFH